MINLWFRDILKDWDKTTWVTGWAAVGDVRELCLNTFGVDGDWRFINEDGYTDSNRLPHGIQFASEEDAIVFRLLL